MTRTSSAAAAAAFGAALFLATSAAALAAGPKAPSEREKIEALVGAVEKLEGATFVRNGAEHDARAAAEHMRRKWKSAEKEIKTARDFIRAAATKSSTSRKPYVIRFKDGKEVESAAFLTERLETMEKGPAGGEKESPGGGSVSQVRS